MRWLFNFSLSFTTLASLSFTTLASFGFSTLASFGFSTLASLSFSTFGSFGFTHLVDQLADQVGGGAHVDTRRIGVLQKKQGG